MSDQVKISSIDALEAFRADLIQYVEKARVALEDAEGEVRRTRTWLDMDRIQHWAGRCKQRTKQLEQAEAELYNATLTSPQESHAFQKMARAQGPAQTGGGRGENARASNNGGRPSKTAPRPLLRQLDPMFFLVGQQLPKGIHSLGEAIKALQAYAEKAPAANPPRPRRTETEEVSREHVRQQGPAHACHPPAPGAVGGNPLFVARPQGRRNSKTCIYPS